MFVVMASLGVMCRAACKCAAPSVSQSANSGNEIAVPFLGDVQADIKHRQEIQRGFLSAASWLAEITDDDEAREISNFLNSNAVTAMNIGPKLLPFGSEKKDQPFWLFIITGNELKEFPFLNAIDVAKGGVGYLVPYHPIPLMIVKYDKRASGLRNGLLILHEGSHARNYYLLQSDAASRSTTDVAFDEVHAYELEIRLLDKLGGEKYQALIQEGIRGLFHPVPEAPLEVSVERERKLNVALDDIFGPSDHLGDERKYLRGRFDLEIAFRYIDQNLLDEKEAASEMKAETYLKLMRQRQAPEK